MGYIYKITNKLTKENYIGKTVKTPEQRFKEHCECAIYRVKALSAGFSEQDLDRKYCTYLCRAIAKYGKENFYVESIEEVPNDSLNQRERFWISYFKSINEAKYNLADGGEGGDLFTNRPEEEKELTRQKISNAVSGEKNGMYGKKHTEMTKEKIRQSYTPDRLEKYRQDNLGAKNPAYGKDPWNKNKILPDTFREKCRIANSGENNNNYGHKYGDSFNHKPVILIKPNGEELEFDCKLACGEYLGYAYGGNVPINKTIVSSDPNKNGCFVKYKN